MLKGLRTHYRAIIVTYVVITFMATLGFLVSYSYLTVIGFFNGGQDSLYEYTALQWSANPGSRKWVSLCGLISCFVHFGVCYCVYVAEFRKRPRWYMPWIIYTIICLVFLYLSFVVRFVVMLEEGTDSALSMLFICLGSLMLHSVLAISKRRKEDMEFEIQGML